MGSTEEKYGQVQIGRAGLGNELLPFARCASWCDSELGTMLPVGWRKLHVGPYLRRESDKRQYHRELRSRVSGPNPVQAMRIKRRLPLVSEDHASEAGSHVRVFSGLGRYFQDLLGAESAVRSALRSHSKVRLPSKDACQSHVAVHVRRGDFGAGSQQSALSGVNNTATPLSVFTEVVQQVRAHRAKQRFLLFTDEPDSAEIQQWAEEHVVEFAPRGTALQHIFLMASCSGVVTSNSTFSGWGAYLGEGPALWSSSETKYARGNEQDFFLNRSGAEEFSRALSARARSSEVR
ncbi:hypothetical protein GCM10027456_31810 [Kineosporia babensis]